MTIEEIEEKLIPKRDIMLNNYEHNEDLSVEEFIYKFISHFNKYYDTVTAKTKGYQCNRNARRTLGDIYRITKHYYPDITLRRVKEILTSLVEKRLISTAVCSYIRRRTYYHESYNYVSTSAKDEFKMRFFDFQQS